MVSGCRSTTAGSVHAIMYIQAHAITMRFVWDKEKSRANLVKHKISFEAACLVFDDPHALSIQDRVVEGEL